MKALLNSLFNSKPFMIGFLLVVFSIPPVVTFVRIFFKYPYGTFVLGALMILSSIILEVLKKLEKDEPTA